MDTLGIAQASGVRTVDELVTPRPGAFTPVGVIWHYTATPPRGRNMPTLNVVKRGRSDLPGPLSQYLLGRDGTVAAITTGKANHAGSGAQRVLDSVRLDRPPPAPWGPQVGGNRWFVGVEMEAGAPDYGYTGAQRVAALKLAIGLSQALDIGPNAHIGHSEWTARKGDPGDNWSMPEFRQQIAAGLTSGPTPTRPNQEVDVTEAEINTIVLRVLDGLVGDPKDPADGYGEASADGSRTALGIRVAKVIQDEHAKTREAIADLAAKLG